MFHILRSLYQFLSTFLFFFSLVSFGVYILFSFRGPLKLGISVCVSFFFFFLGNNCSKISTITAIVNKINSKVYPLKPFIVFQSFEHSVLILNRITYFWLLIIISQFVHKNHHLCVLHFDSLKNELQ